MKTILVPCDFSKEAVEAYKFALDISEQSDLDVKVVNMIDIPVYIAGVDVPYYTYDTSLRAHLQEAALKQFNDMKKKVGGSSRVSFEVIYDNVLSGIRSLEKKESIELVVMGTTGSSGIEEILFGSNTEKVVRFCKAPVIAIRRAPDFSKIKTIVFPNDLALDQSDLINRIKDLQDFFNAQIHLLWVNTPARFRADSEIQGMMQEFVQHYGLKGCKLVIKSDVTEESGILHYSREIGADMIAMATNGRRGLSHLLNGSIAEDVVNHVDCPIWTFSTRVKQSVLV